MEHVEVVKVEKTTKRNSTLDAIRGIAVILVLFNHTVLPVNLDNIDVLPNPVFKFAVAVVGTIKRGGWIGVDLFFVLSGFLVSGLLFNEYRKTAAINAKRFLIRRGFKLYPSFIFFLGVTFTLEIASKLRSGEPFQSGYLYLYDLLFLHNYLGGKFIHTWSLDVEEHFYLLLTAFFVVLAKSKRIDFTILISTYIGLLILGLISRLIVNITHPAYDFNLHFTQTHTRLDALFFGVILSYLNIFKKEKLLFIRNNKTILILICLLYLSTNFVFNSATNNWISVLSLSINPICFGILMLIALDEPRLRIENKSLSFVGRNSYSIYLWHYVIFTHLGVLSRFHVNTSTLSGFMASLVFYFSLSIGVGVFFTRVIEDPLLNFRNRHYPSKIK